jgi:alcohol dehydrogenase class IV
VKLTHPTHQQPARVTFGTGSIRVLGDGFDGRTLVFLSGDPDVRAVVTAALARRGLALDGRQVLVKPAGEPTRAMIEMGAAFLKGRRPRRLVGIGGGSVLDWCRLALAAARGALDLATGQIGDGRALESRPPLWLVPTTCATGAEAAGVAVYADGGRKIPVLSPSFIADRVVLDGRFLATVPRARLAAFLGDTLTHAVEAFVSIVPGTLAKEAAVSAARLVLADRSSTPTSRNERLMEAGYLAGLAASNCSVGVVHAFSHSVACYGIAHGFANAMALDAGIVTNGGAAAVSELVTRLGLSVAGLRRAIGAVLAPAGEDPASERLADLLSSRDSRTDIIARMSSDVCMRTNPGSLTAIDLERFLDHVRRTVGEFRAASPVHEPVMEPVS